MTRTISLAAVVLLAAPLVAQIEGEAKNQPGPGNPIVTPQVNEEIVPSSARNRMGGSANSIPWSWTPTHFMSVYRGSELPQKAYPIRCIGFRTNNRVDTGATIDIEIWLGYTTFNEGNITTTYASNYNAGLKPILVYKRKKLKLANMERNTAPLFFQYQIQLDTPFLYTPKSGRNLIFECKVHGNSAGNRSFSFFPDNARTTTTRIYSNSNANATTGFITRRYAPVLRFDIACKVNGDISPYGAGCRGTGGFAGAILPPQNAAKFGNSSHYYGYGRSNMVWMQIMKAASIKAPMRITGLAFRQSARTNGRRGGTQKLEVRIGKTTSTPTGLNTDFSKNFDVGKPVTAFKGNINIPSTTGRGTNPGEFFLKIPFTTPWVFIPVPNQNIAVQTINTSASNAIVYSDYNSRVGSESGMMYAFTSTATFATSVLPGRGYVIGLTTAGAGRATPVLGSSGRPVIGRSFDITLTLAKAKTAAINVTGFSDKKWGAFTLPLPLAALGAPGCSLLAAAEIFLPTATDATGAGKTTIAAPNVKALIGKNMFHQYLVIDTGANALGMAFSNGGKVTFGEQ